MKNGVPRVRLALVLSLLLGLGGVFASPHSAQGQVTYSQMVATTINEAGTMAGSVRAEKNRLAVIWEIDRFIVLPSLPGGQSSNANGINSAGTIVGSWFSGTEEWLPVVWIDGEITALSTLGTGANSGGSAADINDRGQIVGSSWTDSIFDMHAVLWQDGAITDLGCLPGDSSCSATAINENGQIVGYSVNPDYESRPVLWQDGQISVLCMLPGHTEGAASDVIDDGRIVGYTSFLDDSDEEIALPVLWLNGMPIPLQVLPRDASGYAKSINNAGQIVGNSDDGYADYQALRWEGGQVEALGSLPGDDESLAFDINDQGQIVGSSFLKNDEDHATLWQDGEVIALGGQGSMTSEGMGWGTPPAVPSGDAERLNPADGAPAMLEVASQPSCSTNGTTI